MTLSRLAAIHRGACVDRRHGLTLIELLVVIAILAIVTAATVPIMAPAVETRRIREAARLTGAMFSGAQTRALSTGRSAGVILQRMTAANAQNASMELFGCEIPPPYSGDTMQSGVAITAADPATGIGTATFIDAPASKDFVIKDDQIRFNYQGPYYKITSFDTTTYEFKFSHPSKHVPAVTPDDGVAPPERIPFQILRQPVRTSDSPVQLPDGAVVDLYSSGVGGTNNGVFANADLTKPIIITFAPNGSLDYIYDSGAPPVRPTGPVYLLIGDREKIPDEPFLPADPDDIKAEKHNYSDLENLWIAIQPQTGMVYTGNISSDLAPPATTYQEAIADSRRIAASGQGLGGG